MDNILVLLGKRIASLRFQNKLTQENLAELVNYSPNHISKLELARTNPSFDLLVSIAHALNVELKDLFAFDEYEDINFIKKDFLKLIDSADVKKLTLLYKIFKVL